MKNVLTLQRSEEHGFKTAEFYFIAKRNYQNAICWAHMYQLKHKHGLVQYMTILCVVKVDASFLL